MDEHSIVLLFLTALGILSNNKLISAGASLLLIFKVLRLDLALAILERRSLECGLILLVIAVLLPFSTGEIRLREIWASLWSVQGMIAVAGGVVASFMNQRGVCLLQDSPQIIVGILVGTILGVTLFQGIPVGPLAAAGITAVLLYLVNSFF